MAVRSAFRAIFGSFPILVYFWIFLGITTSILTLLSIIFPGWIQFSLPVMSTTDTGVGYTPVIWGGYIFIIIATFSFYMLWRRR